MWRKVYRLSGVSFGINAGIAILSVIAIKDHLVPASVCFALIPLIYFCVLVGTCSLFVAAGASIGDILERSFKPKPPVRRRTSFLDDFILPPPPGPEV